LSKRPCHHPARAGAHTANRLAIHRKVLGGLLLGVIEIYLAAYLPDAALPFHGAITLGIVILILVARPQGLIAPRREPAR
jgi:branched-subunit amino acid ABC-type transport system permease component